MMRITTVKSVTVSPHHKLIRTYGINVMKGNSLRKALMMIMIMMMIKIIMSMKKHRCFIYDQYMPISTDALHDVNCSTWRVTRHEYCNALKLIYLIHNVANNVVLVSTRSTLYVGMMWINIPLLTKTEKSSWRLMTMTEWWSWWISYRLMHLQTMYNTHRYTIVCNRQITLHT